MPKPSAKAFFSRRTLYQLIAYWLVGVFEWFVGFYLFKHLGFTSGFFAFGIQSVIVGFIAFLLRKYLVFKV
jgi:ABC-type multidrug transport system permease subunit